MSDDQGADESPVIQPNPQLSSAYASVRAAMMAASTGCPAQDLTGIRGSLTCLGSPGLEVTKIAQNVAKLIDTSAGIPAISDQVRTIAKAMTALQTGTQQYAGSLFDATTAARMLRGLPSATDMVAETRAQSSAAAHAARLIARTDLLRAHSALWSGPPLGHQLANLANAANTATAMNNWMRTTPQALAGFKDAVNAATAMNAWMRHAPQGLAGFKDIINATGAMDRWMRQTQQSLIDTMRQWKMPSAPNWMTEAMRAPHEAVTAMMRTWSTLAGAGSWAARIALRMAMAAKQAVERGDLDAVKRFMREWLGFRVIPIDLIHSASLVLLDIEEWLPDGLGLLDLDDYDPCPKLRSLTLAEHRRLTRFITDPERPLNGHPVRSLNAPVRTHESTTTLLELVAAKPQHETDDDLDDPRLQMLLDKLTDRERRIFRERGHTRNWHDAAVACGQPPAAGERLRRKAKRLSEQIRAQVANTEDTNHLDTLPGSTARDSA